MPTISMYQCVQHINVEDGYVEEECICYFSVAVVKHHNQATRSRHQAQQLEQETEGSHPLPKAQSKEKANGNRESPSVFSACIQRPSSRRSHSATKCSYSKTMKNISHSTHQEELWGDFCCCCFLCFILFQIRSISLKQTLTCRNINLKSISQHQAMSNTGSQYSLHSVLFSAMHHHFESERTLTKCI